MKNANFFGKKLRQVPYFYYFYTKCTRIDKNRRQFPVKNINKSCVGFGVYLCPN